MLGIEREADDVLLFAAQQPDRQAAAGVLDGCVQRRAGAQLSAAGFDEHVGRRDPRRVGR
jgi:hypothetical protein